jgi:hypothetical protein
MTYRMSNLTRHELRAHIIFGKSDAGLECAGYQSRPTYHSLRGMTASRSPSTGGRPSTSSTAWARPRRAGRPGRRATSPTNNHVPAAISRSTTYVGCGRAAFSVSAMPHCVAAVEVPRIERPLIGKIRASRLLMSCDPVAPRTSCGRQPGRSSRSAHPSSTVPVGRSESGPPHRAL